MIRRERHVQVTLHRLQKQLADKQRDVEQAERRVQQVLSSLIAMYDDKAFAPGASSEQSLADYVVQSVSPLLAVETVVLMRWSPATADYGVVAARGLSPQQMRSTRVRPGEGLLGRVAQQGVPASALKGPALAVSDSMAFLKAPYMVYPLGGSTPSHGLLILCRSTAIPFEADTQRIADLLVKHVGVRLENIEAQETCQSVYIECLNALVQAVSSKDGVSEQHSQHCREWVREMARAMQLPPAVAEQIEYAALLHDIGKLAVSETLLSKPGALTPEEYAVVKNHPVIGHQMLKSIDFLKAVAPIVLYHHEWVNGDGYPEGLVGEEIPLGARMVAIIDAWDAMTSDQPYRKAMARNTAIAELRQQAGSQFDPKLVDVFLHVIEKKIASTPISPAPSSNA